MPTRLRVDLAGYHHIINRGVNHWGKGTVFFKNHRINSYARMNFTNATLEDIKKWIETYMLLIKHI